MGIWKKSILCAVLSFSPLAARAQWEVEGDPTAYVLKGYSAHVGHTLSGGKSTLQFGAFGAETPEWVHGNAGWTENSRGVTFKFDYYLFPPLRGLFVGLDSNYARVRYTLHETDQSSHRNIVGLGPRVGYRFEVGRHLYVSPWVSLDYQFNARDVVISGKTFKQGQLSIFPAVHVGWRF
jgi:hypothetical protein